MFKSRPHEVSVGAVPTFTASVDAAYTWSAFTRAVSVLTEPVLTESALTVLAHLIQILNEPVSVELEGKGASSGFRLFYL